MPVPLRPNVTPKEAVSILQGVLADLEKTWAQESGPILARMLSGEITREEGSALLVEVVKDLEDEVRDRLVDALDTAWDFSAVPGGPIGVLLEGMDSLVWEGLLEVVGSAGAPFVVWLRDLVTVDDVEKQARAKKLLDRADALDQKAATVENPNRAERLRDRARHKRERAQKLLE